MTARALAALVTLAVSITGASAENIAKADWSLLTVTYSGGVAFLGSLTAEQCQRVQERLAPHVGCPDGGSVCKPIILSSDIVRAECLH